MTRTACTCVYVNACMHCACAYILAASAMFFAIFGSDAVFRSRVCAQYVSRVLFSFVPPSCSQSDTKMRTLIILAAVLFLASVATATMQSDTDALIQKVHLCQRVAESVSCVWRCVLLLLARHPTLRPISLKVVASGMCCVFYYYRSLPLGCVAMCLLSLMAVYGVGQQRVHRSGYGHGQVV